MQATRTSASPGTLAPASADALTPAPCDHVFCRRPGSQLAAGGIQATARSCLCRPTSPRTACPQSSASCPASRSLSHVLAQKQRRGRRATHGARKRTTSYLCQARNLLGSTQALRASACRVSKAPLPTVDARRNLSSTPAHPGRRGAMRLRSHRPCPRRPHIGTCSEIMTARATPCSQQYPHCQARTFSVGHVLFACCFRVQV